MAGAREPRGHGRTGCQSVCSPDEVLADRPLPPDRARLVEPLDPRGEVTPVGRLVGEVSRPHHCQRVVVGGLGEARAEAQLPEPVLEPYEVQLVEHRRFEAVGRSDARRVRGDRDGGNEHC